MAWFLGFLAVAPLARADYWVRYSPVDPPWEPAQIEPVADCDWLLSGDVETVDGNDWDAVVVKMDERGGVVWTRAFGGSQGEFPRGIAESGDGGYVVAVRSDSFGARPELSAGPWLVKLDAAGSIEWQISYEDGFVADVAGPLPGGGVLVLGAIDRDLWLIDLAATGDEIRQRRLTGAGEAEVGFDLERTCDGGFIVAGVTASFGAGGADLWLVKLDPYGEIEWQSSYGDAGDEHTPHVQQLSSGEYLLAGVRRRDDNGDLVEEDVIWRLNTLGRPIWHRRFDGVGGTAGSKAVVETPDGGGVIAHDADPAGLDQHDMRLLRFDASGSPVWMREYGGEDRDVSSDAYASSDGGLFLVGAGNSFSRSGQVLRLDADGLIGGATCDLIRDVLVSEVPYAPHVTDTDAWFEETDIGRFETDAVPWQPDIVLNEQCSAPSCLAARCGYATAEPLEVCEGEPVTLTLSSACGEGAVSVGWDLDGDGVADKQGMQVQATLAAGVHKVAAMVSDSCPDPGPGSCASKAQVTVLSSEPPGEISGPAEPRLRVARLEDGIVRIAVEDAPEASAYNVYADRLGSWYAPTAAKGSACGLTQWTGRGGGAVEFEHLLPRDSWIVVTASTPCAEGPAGPDSAGRERTDLATWQMCGPAPR